MTIFEPSFPYLTWDCADDLEGRLKKTLYHGGKSECMGAVSSAALADLAVSVYIAAAPSPKRKLRPGYIGSISNRLAVNPCTMMLGILYCERMRQINPDYLSKISSSDLFIVSLVVASKFLNDEGEDDEIFNDEWAEAGGLAVSTVNRLERDFLSAMKWKAYVSPKEFLTFCNKLETSIALKHGLDRGWFSYTDLTNLLAHIHFVDATVEFLQNMFQIMMGCTIVYGLSVGFLLSSMICFNATLGTKSMTDAHGNMPDPVHPFIHRKITRIRQNVASTVAEDTSMPQISGIREAPSRPIDEAVRKDVSCNFPNVVTELPITFNNSFSHTRRNFRNDVLDIPSSQTNDCERISIVQPKPEQRIDIQPNGFGVEKNRTVSDFFRIKKCLDILPEKNTTPRNHILYDGFLNLVMKANKSTLERRVVDETLFPFGKFLTVDGGLFGIDLSVTYFGAR